MPRFSEIIGHELTKNHLQNAITADKISHAYIFCGEEGSGKKLLAKTFAQAIQCEKHEAEPCLTCKSCLQALSNNHPDISYVQHEKSKISVDEIRQQVNNTILIKPYYSNRKIIIIPDAQKMTEQAQNALLKTIEEPPEYAVIILLTTNRTALLQTILSRCITLELKPIDTSLVEKYLMDNYEIPDYLAHVSAAFSGGIIGRAINFSTNEDFIEIKDKTIDFLKISINTTTSELIDTLKFFLQNSKQVETFFDLMMLWYRDVMLFKATRNANNIIFSDEITTIIKQADRLGFDKLNDIQEAIYKAKIRINANVNFELAMELLLTTCKG